MPIRKVCIVTGSRAEYGQLYWLLKEVEADPELQLQLVVTGMHLSPEFGLTCVEIEREFTIDARVEMLLSSDTAVGVAKSMGLGVIGFADAIASLAPDLLVLPGDRYEILAVALAALVARVPIAHVQGGEVTQGAIDESIRHALTKMSHLHLVAAEPYRRRVVQMGENPDHVLNVGALSLDNIRRMRLLSRDELEAELNCRLRSPVFVVTYHPATHSEAGARAPVEALLRALDAFPDATVIFTKSNADTGGRTVNGIIDDYVAARGESARAFVSLGQLRYLSLLAAADAVIGNSSSGITEAPALRVPTINLGDRQEGRLKASSIIDCPENAPEITAAIGRALSPEFRAAIGAAPLPYGDGTAARKMVDVFKSVDLTNICRKKFYDRD